MSEKYISASLLKAAVVEAYEELPLDIRAMERADALIKVIDKFPAADVEPVVRKAGDLIDVIFSHNSIIALHEERSEEEGRPMYEAWRGMAHELPEQYKQRKFLRIFGSIPDSITRADTINILVERSAHAERSMKE